MYKKVFQRSCRKQKSSKVFDCVVTDLQEAKRAGVGNVEKTKQSTKQKRDKLLTVCFFSTTVAFICFWSIYYTAQFFIHIRQIPFNEMKVPLFVFRAVYKLPVDLYAMINPMIFIVVNSKFLEPFKKLLAVFKRDKAK